MLYLIKQKRPSYHNAPFHPVIICDRKRVADWEVDWSGAGSFMWSAELNHANAGWLLERWNGLGIDYGHVVRSFDLPDGSSAGFYRPYQCSDPKLNISGLFVGAVWWSDRRLPKLLSSMGVIYPPDEFSRQQILDVIANDGCMGIGRDEPDFWEPISNAVL